MKTPKSPRFQAPSQIRTERTAQNKRRHSKTQMQSISANDLPFLFFNATPSHRFGSRQKSLTVKRKSVNWALFSFFFVNIGRSQRLIQLGRGEDRKKDNVHGTKQLAIQTSCFFFIRHVKATSFHTKDERQRKTEIYVAAFVLSVGKVSNYKQTKPTEWFNG